MCIFVDQFGNVRFAYRTYKIQEVGLDARGDGAYPRKVRPNTPVDIVHNSPQGPAASVGNWGMNTGRFDWNARDDRLDESPLWSSLWGRRDCHVLIPVSHGYEMTKRHGDRRWSCIVRADDPEKPWWVPGLGRIQAGKFRTEWHATMVTVPAGPVFEPIHDTPREIVALRTWDECLTWLGADPDACRRLLRPALPDVLRSYRVHDDVLKESFPAEKAPLPFKPSGLDAFA